MNKGKRIEVHIDPKKDEILMLCNIRSFSDFKPRNYHKINNKFYGKLTVKISKNIYEKYLNSNFIEFILNKN